MTKEIDCALQEWEFARSNSVEFIKTLGNDGLKIKLPRPELDVFCKHFQEMISIQKLYINAIKVGEMLFDDMDEEFDGQATTDDLIKSMNELDEDLKRAISETDYSLEIKWDGGEIKTISSHLCALSTHEIFHIGQLVAFCYVAGIKLPQEIVTNWALSPQE